jgi:hypothetical protein
VTYYHARLGRRRRNEENRLNGGLMIANYAASGTLWMMVVDGDLATIMSFEEK